MPILKTNQQIMKTQGETDFKYPLMAHTQITIHCKDNHLARANVHPWMTTWIPFAGPLKSRQFIKTGQLPTSIF
jgi:hypothetical protein